MPSTTAISVGVGLILLGILLVIAGSVLSGDSNVRAGGVIFIGPIPIPFGNRKAAAASLLLGIGILAAYLLFSRL